MRLLCCVLSFCSALSCIRSPDEIPPLPEGGQITGTALGLDAETGALRPLPDAKVSLLAGAYTVFTNRDGFFQLTRLPLGVHALDLEGPPRAGAPTLARRLRGLQILSDGQSVDIGPIELTERGDLEGALALADERSPEGALIVVPQSVFRAIADQDGRYLVAGLPAGVFDLVAFRDGYAPGRLQGLNASAGERKQVTRIVLERAEGALSFEVRGVALLADQRTASSGIRVTFTHEVETASVAGPVATTPDGNYVLEVPVGVYRARFEKDGYRAVEISGVAVLSEAVLGLGQVVLSRAAAGDLDGDGIPDDGDEDRDNDGCSDALDAFPDDPFACADSDSDGIPDSRDADDDNDELSDAEELSPGRDGVATDPLRSDSDGDSVSDASDLCPTVFEESAADRDGDGQGDACDDEPIVRGFSPPRIGIGGRIVIQGHGFNTFEASSNIVVFGSGASTGAYAATANLLNVTVPPGALSGPLTVYTGFGFSTTTATLAIVPPPAIEQVRPSRAPPGATIELLGRYLLGSPSIQLGTDPGLLPAVSESVVDPTQTPPLERLQFVIPADRAPGSYTIRLSSAGGTTVSGLTLEIIDQPTIESISPARANIGQLITIRGFRFDLTGTGGSAKIAFTGGVETDPVSLSDTAISAIVPPGAQTGPVEVRHPGGNAVSPSALQIDSLLPVIAAISRSVASPGDTVTLTGSFLHDPSEGRELVEVLFGGVPAETLSSVDDFAIRAVVPDNAVPGPVQARVRQIPSGTIAVAEAPFALHLLERTHTSADLARVIGLGFSPDGSNAYAVRTTPSQGLVLDPNTLAIRAPTTLPITLNSAARFYGSPSGDLGYLVASGDVHMVELPTFALTACNTTNVLFFWGADPAPPPDQHLAYFARGTTNVSQVLQVAVTEDPKTGALSTVCRELSFDALASVRAMIPAREGNGRIMVGGSEGAFWADGDPNSATFGTIVSPALGPVLPRVRLFWDPSASESRLWFTDELNQPLRRITVAPGGLPTFAPMPSLPSMNFGDALASPNGRWLLGSVGRTGPLMFYDLSLTRNALDLAVELPYTTFFGAAVRPTAGGFVLLANSTDASGTLTTTHRFVFRQAP